MNKIKLAFFGAPDFAATVLKSIIEDKKLPVELKFVVTQPDRPAGRKQALTPTPVKLLAQEKSISVYDNFKSEIVNLKLKEIDLVLLYAFGEIIPTEMLKLPPQGFWNIHPSLLPKYRGPSPITYPLFLGDAVTGVSLIQMDERMDHGPIISQETYTIQNEDTQETLKKSLSNIGYKLFKNNVQLLIDGALQKKEQIHENATYNRLLTKQDGFIPFPLFQKIVREEALTKDDILPIIQAYFKKYGPSLSFNFQLSAFNLFRALSPWPGLWSLIPVDGVEKRLKITGMKLTDDNRPLITTVQLEGKKEVPLSTFLSAYTI